MERKELSRQWKKETGNAGSANIKLYATKKILPQNSCNYYIDVLVNNLYYIKYGPFLKSESKSFFLYKLFKKIEKKEKNLINFKAIYYYLDNDERYIIMENLYRR